MLLKCLILPKQSTFYCVRSAEKLFFAYVCMVLSAYSHSIFTLSIATICSYSRPKPLISHHHHQKKDREPSVRHSSQASSSTSTFCSLASLSLSCMIFSDRLSKNTDASPEHRCIHVSILFFHTIVSLSNLINPLDPMKRRPTMPHTNKWSFFVLDRQRQSIPPCWRRRYRRPSRHPLPIPKRLQRHTNAASKWPSRPVQTLKSLSTGS